MEYKIKLKSQNNDEMKVPSVLTVLFVPSQSEVSEDKELTQRNSV